MSTIALLLLIVAAFAVLAMAQAGSNAVFEGLVDAVGRSRPEAKRRIPKFVTSLAPAEVEQLARQAASASATVVQSREGEELQLTVTDGTRGQIVLRIGADRAGETVAQVALGKPAADRDALGRFHGGLLAALRSRDPAVRQS